MNRFILLSTLFLVAFPGSSFARPVHVIPFAEQLEKADLVVIAHPAAPTVYKGDLQRQPVWTVEVTTTFTVEAVIKGDSKLRQFTLLHHEYKDPVSHIEIVDGPGYIRFAKNDERPCLMFLKRTERGEYIPYCGQYDPGVSIRVMEFASHPGLDINAFCGALERAWEFVGYLSRTHDVLAGASDQRLTFDGGVRATRAEVSFQRNAILPAEGTEFVAKDASKPFCYIGVIMWLHDADKPEPDQPTANVHTLELDGLKYRLSVHVAASDHELATQLRSTFARACGSWTENASPLPPMQPSDRKGTKPNAADSRTKNGESATGKDDRTAKSLGPAESDVDDSEDVQLLPVDSFQIARHDLATIRTDLEASVADGWEITARLRCLKQSKTPGLYLRAVNKSVSLDDDPFSAGGFARFTLYLHPRTERAVPLSQTDESRQSTFDSNEKYTVYGSVALPTAVEETKLRQRIKGVLRLTSHRRLEDQQQRALVRLIEDLDALAEESNCPELQAFDANVLEREVLAWDPQQSQFSYSFRMKESESGELMLEEQGCVIEVAFDRPDSPFHYEHEFDLPDYATKAVYDCRVSDIPSASFRKKVLAIIARELAAIPQIGKKCAEACSTKHKGGASQAVDVLAGYAGSPAIDATVDWHRQVGEQDIRMSYLSRGDPNVAMRCVANLSTYQVTTYREVHDHATQSTKTRPLSHSQVLSIRGIVEHLTAPDKNPPLENLLIVSFVLAEEPRTLAFDATKPPPDVVRLYDLTGAYLPVAADAEQSKRTPVNLDRMHQTTP